MNQISLEGKCFHTVVDGEIDKQGRVVTYVMDGVFLVEFFEWVLGEPSGMGLVKLSEMMDWKIYDSAEEMGFHFQRSQISSPKSVTESP